MKKLSAGILMWRRGANGVEVLLGHFGGPICASRWFQLKIAFVRAMS